MLTIKSLNAGYGELEVLKEISLDVNEKEIVALIGPNGAGKSTVIKSIFGLTDITSGGIKLNSADLIGLSSHELIKMEICYINQGKNVFGNLKVRENLEIGASLIKSKKKIQSLLHEVYKKFPVLKEREDNIASTLSGGQRQILAFGRALMQSPKILLLDEPSLGLSPKMQSEIFTIVKKMKDEGMSVLIVEQNAKKAIEIADKVYLLEDGKIVLSGSGKFILKHKKIKEVYLGGRY